MSLNFHADLATGRKAEYDVADIFKLAGFHTTVLPDTDLFSSHDIEVQHPEGSLKTIEVKSDHIAPYTKNVAVEFQKRKDNKIIPSGISISNADYIVYCFPQHPSFYLIPLPDLLSLLSNKKYKYTRWGGDENISHLALFDFDFFKKECVAINANVLKRI
ncbi:hypothetical protein DCC81_23945 [Chitinophaga parva]|uniref:Endonuclease n=1 Tax=Chitinophaga parva TaxID=2169414 RepID=A0A2T7BEB7_9BACT|nr:hypothetical protein [Chitinophaga parva]PUZ23434.1 hypothetical protein DCC81_23945 [Chitinophaga parva]